MEEKQLLKSLSEAYQLIERGPTSGVKDAKFDPLKLLDAARKREQEEMKRGQAARDATNAAQPSLSTLATPERREAPAGAATGRTRYSGGRGSELRPGGLRPDARQQPTVGAQPTVVKPTPEAKPEPAASQPAASQPAASQPATEPAAQPAATTGAMVDPVRTGGGRPTTDQPAGGGDRTKLPPIERRTPTMAELRAAQAARAAGGSEVDAAWAAYDVAQGRQPQQPGQSSQPTSGPGASTPNVGMTGTGPVKDGDAYGRQLGSQPTSGPSTPNVGMTGTGPVKDGDAYGRQLGSQQNNNRPLARAITTPRINTPRLNTSGVGSGSSNFKPNAPRLPKLGEDVLEKLAQHLLDENYCDTLDEARTIITHMSDLYVHGLSEGL